MNRDYVQLNEPTNNVRVFPLGSPYGTLLQHHIELLRASAITPDVAAERGYASITTRADLRRLGFGDRQGNVPALILPIHNVQGEVAFYQVRPDVPRIDKVKALKYEMPKGTSMALDVPPRVRPMLGDPAIPLFVTEGVRKADAAASIGLACIDLLGVWNFRGTNDKGGKTALADWECIALNDRAVYIAFDSDVMTKPAVHAALVRLKAFLESRRAHVRLVYLPSGEHGEKVGLDDYLASGHDKDDLLALATTELRAIAGNIDETSYPYEATEHGLVRHKALANGEAETVPLSNFDARIVADIAEDDGSDEIRRLFAIKAVVHGRSLAFTVPAERFYAMTWPLETMGAGAIVYAGMGARDHARVAIQALSGDVPVRHVYRHTGWREVDGVRVYLHAGGAIGAEGAVGEVSVKLDGALAGYLLPDSPTGADRSDAVIRLFEMLDLAPGRIIIPLLCAVFRSVMGGMDGSVALVGQTGQGKSELAALIQQFFGAGLDARHLPGNWSSTENALEGLAFEAKDAVLVIDDFAPTGTQADVQRLHAKADRVLRGQGNGSGRQRMRADGSLRPAKPPRGLIVVTGEDVPKGHSLRSRMLVLELDAGAVDWDWMTVCQERAAAGEYAKALAAFIHWLAPRYDEIRATMHDRIAELRRRATASGMHRRTPEIVANLFYGWGEFLRFAEGAGALRHVDVEALGERAWEALGEAAAAQAGLHEASDPVLRYQELLAGALAGGQAHVASKAGDSRFGDGTEPAAWGWRSADEGMEDDWHPQGLCIGWLDGDDLYLEPETAFKVAQRLASDQGESLPISKQTLHKRLDERDLLMSRDEARGRLVVRHTVAGARLAVLHVHSTFLHRE